MTHFTSSLWRLIPVQLLCQQLQLHPEVSGRQVMHGIHHFELEVLSQLQ